MTEQRDPSSRYKRALLEGLVGLGGGPTLADDVASIRMILEAHGSQAATDRAQVEELRRNVEVLAFKLSTLAEEVREQVPEIPDETERIANIDRTLMSLSQTVAGLTERVHSNRLRIVALEEQFERFIGSVQDEMALDRRLRSIENHLLGIESDA